MDSLKLMRNVNSLLLSVNDPTAELHIWQKLVKLFEAELIKEQLADSHLLKTYQFIKCRENGWN